MTDRETLLLLCRPVFTASELSREAGVSRQYVSDALRGIRPPSDRLMAAAERLYGQPLRNQSEGGQA